MIQFRLSTLFIITTASALIFWALYAPPQWLGLLAIYLLYFVLASSAVSGIVFHRGYWQAFFMGPSAVACNWFIPNRGSTYRRRAALVVYERIIISRRHRRADCFQDFSLDSTPDGSRQRCRCSLRALVGDCG